MPPPYSAFLGTRRIASGELPEVARIACEAANDPNHQPLRAMQQPRPLPLRARLRARAAARSSAWSRVK